ncbi:hypothetical protein ACF052_32220 [Streptomyces pilosus]
MGGGTRDYETSPAHAETMIRWAMIGITVAALPEADRQLAQAHDR